MKAEKKKLLSILKKKSYNYREDPPFTLASGKESPHYVNCKPTTNNAEGMALTGEIIFSLIKDLDVQAVGGLTMGADPISHAVSMVSFQRGTPINSFCVRKQAKTHGLIKAHKVEGSVSPGDNVVIIEDVVTTGQSTLQAINAAEEYGLKIVKVIILVDRQDDGKESIQKRLPDIDVDAIFTLSDFVKSA